MPWDKEATAIKISRVQPMLSATLAKSGPLDFPSEKSFLLFLPMKRV